MTDNLALAIGDPNDVARVAESLVTKGDVSGLSAEERTRYYLATCHALGLNPAAAPFAFLRLNGKEIMYPTRGATDQLAALHRVNRELIRGPEVVDLAGVKVVLAVCKATLPNGRSEVSTAAVPLPSGAEMVCNALMKAETKGKRRATLAILGLALLDESETDTLPASVRDEPALPRIDPRPEPVEPPPVDGAAWGAWLSELSDAPTAADVRAVYLSLADRLRADGEDPTVRLSAAGAAVSQRLEALGHRIASAELRALLQPTPEAGRLAAMADMVCKLERTVPAAARWWRVSRGAVPDTLSATIRKLLARHIAETPDAAGTKAAGLAIAAEVTRQDSPPPSGGGAPAPEAPQSTEASATREPGDESEDDWRRTAEGRAAHAAELTCREHLLRSARKHCDLAGYARVLAERLVALTPPDAGGAVLSLESALAQVNGAMARAQADRRAAQDARASVRRAA